MVRNVNGFALPCAAEPTLGGPLRSFLFPFADLSLAFPVGRRGTVADADDSDEGIRGSGHPRASHPSSSSPSHHHCSRPVTEDTKASYASFAASVAAVRCRVASSKNSRSSSWKEVAEGSAARHDGEDDDEGADEDEDGEDDDEGSAARHDGEDDDEGFAAAAATARRRSAAVVVPAKKGDLAREDGSEK